jgi:adenylate cyclase
MSDLRGFTSLAARLAPQQVVAILNRYLGAMAEVISRYEGTIDEFIGDAILVIFGAPVRSEDHAARAVACSIAMQAAMDAVNGANRRDGLPEIEMGIGVHTGEVVVGNIGSEARAKYGVVGSPVNLTSRIESYTVGGQILASEATRREVGGIMQVGARLEIEAKGVDEPAVVHTVRGIGGGFDLQLAEEDEETVELGEPVPLRFTTLEGKYLGGEWTPGRLVRLAARSGEVACEGPVAPFTNLKIVLDAGTRAPFPREFYAKCVGSGSQRIDIHITSIPPELAAWLEHRRATSARG